MNLLRKEHYIDGVWQSSAETYPVLNPATADVIADVSKAGARETQQAIQAAEGAFPAWRALTAKERGARVRRWGELMLEHRNALAELLTREQGKPLAEAQGEVAYAASFLEWFAEEAKRSYGDVIPSSKAGSKIIVTREPVGVVAAITPWNFPLAMITRKAGPALAAGCTMVLKPSEETPLSALALAVLAAEAGIPAGVFNVGTVYTYDPALPEGARYPFHQVSDADAWVDDVQSPNYNRFVTIPDPQHPPAWFDKMKMRHGDFA
ncbi:aldehyde dehydrogenase family protein, partial [uncultured Caballeronia sp.]|uniref:aldehyde dehydrogenase family protein n=1 Tax=uncultured Caballeronia sp. TaxID=1827198 RepID=UPI0035CBD0D5